MEVKDLIKISKYAGMREDLVQAGGGNSSVKINETEMLIKASGYQLADLTDTTGISIVDYSKIYTYLKMLVTGNATEQECEHILKTSLRKGFRPSIETFLHALTDSITLHTHSIAFNILGTRVNGECELKKLFPDAITVNYATPGIKLAKRLYIACNESKEKNTNIIFLKNHGIIIGGKTAEEVILTTENVNLKIENYLGINNESYRNAYRIYQLFQDLQLIQGDIIVKVEQKTALDLFSKNGYKIWPYQFCPDCLVYCGINGLELNSLDADDVLKHVKKFGIPVLIAYNKNLYIKAASVKKAREIESLLSFSAQIYNYNHTNQIQYLSLDEQRFLLNWDSEIYRQNIH